VCTPGNYKEFYQSLNNIVLTNMNQKHQIKPSFSDAKYDRLETKKNASHIQDIS
jgi:hypothetical protein